MSDIRGMPFSTFVAILNEAVDKKPAAKPAVKKPAQPAAKADGKVETKITRRGDTITVVNSKGATKVMRVNAQVSFMHAGKKMHGIAKGIVSRGNYKYVNVSVEQGPLKNHSVHVMPDNFV